MPDLTSKTGSDHESFLQNRLHTMVTDYVNGGCLSRGDRLVATISPASLFRKNARRIMKEYQEFAAAVEGHQGRAWATAVQSYAGANVHVQRMAASLRDFVAQGFISVFVHGSVATSEEIRYSDLDALVILNRRAFSDATVLSTIGRALSLARGFMLEMDPLQHHGWFVLTEAELSFYCEAYFPAELFRYSRTLATAQEQWVRLTLRDSAPEIRRNFCEVSTSLLRSLDAQDLTRHAYALKNALSLFMLLPALYLQVRHGRSLYKKFSFAEARQDFTASEWRSMDEVSDIRSCWSYDILPWQRRLISQPHSLRRRVVPWCAPAIPAQIKRRITPQLTREMIGLVTRMNEQVNGSERVSSGRPPGVEPALRCA